MAIVLQVILAILTIIITALVVLKLYLNTIKGKCTSQADLTGKVAIVTGANVGIGYYTALDLARRKARVILACRDQKKGREAAEKIKTETGNNDVVVMELDLSLMKSVQEFAELINKRERRLDILVNNAGVAGLPATFTEEGFEVIFASNYFGHFLLTNLLISILQKSHPSRVVNLSSMAHRWSKGIDFDNLKAEKSFSCSDVYFTSKLANILFTRELARRWEGSGVGCYVADPGFTGRDMFISSPIMQQYLLVILRPWMKVYNHLHSTQGRSRPNCYGIYLGILASLNCLSVGLGSVHPGTVRSSIWRGLPRLHYIFMAIPLYLFFKTSEEGAQTSIYCAVSEDLEKVSGKYYVDCKEAEDQCSDLSKDMGVAKKLWEISEKYTGLDDED